MVHTFVVVAINTDQNIVPRVLIDTSASNNQPTTEWIKEELEEELYGLTSFNPKKIKVGKRMVEPSVNCLKIFNQENCTIQICILRKSNSYDFKFTFQRMSQNEMRLDFDL